jgi:hypothetical protein
MVIRRIEAPPLYGSPSRRYLLSARWARDAERSITGFVQREALNENKQRRRRANIASLKFAKRTGQKVRKANGTVSLQG